jgi:hypothetical protein
LIALNLRLDMFDGARVKNPINPVSLTSFPNKNDKIRG